MFPLILLISIVLTACGEEKPYEIIKTESKVTEFDDRIQLEFQFEINNYTDKDYYFSLVFPSYIQEALITKVEFIKIMADSTNSGVMLVTASKDGGQMSEETIKSIINGGLPFVEQILIGKTLNLN
ncbi:hypothetical protein [Bacillus sp. SM2101]|uniref:hypothetical protein n=1 Tax=Bacillus sp. SM2101 TaxID=2805366 RepID=UPI001BDF6B82|nr:hypothetical protein [Bacillus sp. SM2101]